MTIQVYFGSAITFLHISFVVVVGLKFNPLLLLGDKNFDCVLQPIFGFEVTSYTL
jgi:hypothetical protein